MFTDEEYLLHQSSHSDALFQCSICSVRFVSWQEAGRHVRRHKVDQRKVILPADAERLLTASCKFRPCRGVFIGVTKSDMEHHLFSRHWKSRKKGGVAVQWSCRMCNNAKKRFTGYSAAIKHAELHKAGLIASARPDDMETDTSDGGFTSGSDCISEEEDETDLSSVSERETDLESDNDGADGKEFDKKSSE